MREWAAPVRILMVRALQGEDALYGRFDFEENAVCAGFGSGQDIGAFDGFDEVLEILLEGGFGTAGKIKIAQKSLSDLLCHIVSVAAQGVEAGREYFFIRMLKETPGVRALIAGLCFFQQF